MKLWWVSIRQAAEDRGRHKQKDGVTRYIVHADTQAEADRIAIDQFKGDIIKKKFVGIRSSEEGGHVLWQGHYLTDADMTGWRKEPIS